MPVSKTEVYQKKNWTALFKHLKMCASPSKANCCFLFWQVPSMLSSNLNAEALQYLQGYLQAATVQLV